MVELDADTWQALLRLRVGAFFRNTFRSPGLTCLYCTGPSSTPTCTTCEGHRRRFGDRLADAVIALTYAQDRHPDGEHQSKKTAFAYKRTPPAQTCAEDMSLLVNAATRIHGPCIAGLAGWWDAVTFVPSTKRPGPPSTHPTAELARSVRWNNRKENRLVLAPGPDSRAPSHVLSPERFAVPDMYHARVRGRHVLVVDDTWTTGANMQATAIALKDAGATRITALTVTRWTRWDYPEHRAVLQLLDTPYNPLHCPVHGGLCDVPPTT